MTVYIYIHEDDVLNLAKLSNLDNILPESENTVITYYLNPADDLIMTSLDLDEYIRLLDLDLIQKVSLINN